MNVDITSIRGSDNVSPDTFNALIEELKVSFQNIQDFYASLAGVNSFKEIATFEKNVQAKADLIVTGEIYTASDERIKSDFKEITDGLEKIKKIIPYTYLKNGRLEPGVKAQNIENILEGCVVEVDGVLMVRYDGIIPYLISAIQTLEEKINSK